MEGSSTLTGAGCTLEQAVEAILATSDRAVGAGRIAKAVSEAGLGEAGLGETDARSIEGAIERLNATYAQGGRSYEIVKLAGGYRLATLGSVTGVLAAYHGVRAAGGLTRAALETLAVVAYRQPVARAEIEAIRGVACGEVLRSLMDRKLVSIAGRSEELGRPMLYGTTREFLETFGLASIKDLPSAEGLSDEAFDTPPEAEPEPKPDPEPVPEPGASTESEPEENPSESDS